MPAYSCQFNSIESCWGFLKEKLKRRIAQAVHNINSPEEFQNIISIVISQIPEATFSAFATANRKYLSTFALNEDDEAAE